MKITDKPFHATFMGAMLVALVVGLYTGLNVVAEKAGRPKKLPDNPMTEQVKMQVGSQTIKVEVRDDDRERSLGLSGRESLGEDEGMLFLFGSLQQPMFWMKDMVIDLDVVWIKDGVVMQIDENIPAPTRETPKISTMAPEMPVDMVLELPGGFAGRHKLKLGDEAVLLDK